MLQTKTHERFEVKVGSLVLLKGSDTKKQGMIIEIFAGTGSFETWVDVLWNSGTVETHSIQRLELDSTKPVG